MATISLTVSGYQLVTLHRGPVQALVRLVRRRPLAAHFILAYAASGVALGVIGLPRLDGSGGRPAISLALFPVVVIAAGLAGACLIAACDGRLGLRQLGARMLRWRLGRWWLVLLLPPTAILVVLTAMRALVSPVFAPQLLAFGLGIGLAAGLFAEIGWTGFAYPRLRARFGGLGGALLLGGLWALWPVPVVDSLGAATPHGVAWPAFFASFVAVVAAVRVLIAWVYANTGSLLGAQLTHASSTGFLVVLNPPAVSPGAEALWYLVYAALLWAVVALVVMRSGPSLLGSPRSVLSPEAESQATDIPATA